MIWNTIVAGIGLLAFVGFGIYIGITADSLAKKNKK